MTTANKPYRGIMIVGVIAALMTIAHFAGPTTDTSRASDPATQSIPILKGVPAGNSVIVWKSFEAMGEAMDLIKAGVDGEDTLVRRLVSCFVPEGTKYIRTDNGSFGQGFGGYRNVMIIEGAHKGCKGTVVEQNTKL